MRKSDIVTRNGYPALNVKVYSDPWVGYALDDGSGPDPRFKAWAETLPDTVIGDFWNDACLDGFGHAEDVASEIFGPNAKVWPHGRSDGWLIVEGLPDVETWDALMLSKWATFARRVEELRKETPWRFRDLLYHNAFVPEMGKLAPIVPPAA